MIEDEADVLHNNKKHLEQQGYTVDCAPTLADARVALRRALPDLVLLDVLLPDGSGYAFCEEIRALTTAPIIFATCMDQNENIIQGLKNGGDDYITKPFDLNVLSARVIAQLRRAGLSGAGKIEMPPLVIDLQKGKTTLRGSEVPLTQKEMQLLAFFVSHAGHEFSYENIYEAVWGDAFGDVTSTVKMRISSLRKKLQMDDDNCPFDLRFTRKKGYIFTKIMDEPEW